MSRMAFSSFFEFGCIVVGLFFSFPNLLSTLQVRLRCLTAADIDRRSHCPGTMSSILFAKHVSFEHSKSHSRSVITSRRPEDINNKTKVVQHLIDNQSTSSCLHDQCALRGRCCRCRPRCGESLSNREYQYRSYTQTDATHCWPCGLFFSVQTFVDFTLSLRGHSLLVCLCSRP